MGQGGATHVGVGHVGATHVGGAHVGVAHVGADHVGGAHAGVAQVQLRRDKLQLGVRSQLQHPQRQTMYLLDGMKMRI